MNRHPKIAATCVGLAWLLTATASPASAVPLRVEAAAIDVGAVVAGETAVARFVLVNDSQRDIRILRAAPS